MNDSGITALQCSESVEKNYNMVMESVREECVTWILCSRKLGVSKDIRVVIAKKIWKSRKEGRENETIKNFRLFVSGLVVSK